MKKNFLHSSFGLIIKKWKRKIKHLLIGKHDSLNAYTLFIDNTLYSRCRKPELQNMRIGQIGTYISLWIRMKCSDTQFRKSNKAPYFKIIKARLRKRQKGGLFSFISLCNRFMLLMSKTWTYHKQACVRKVYQKFHFFRRNIKKQSGTDIHPYAGLLLHHIILLTYF